MSVAESCVCASEVRSWPRIWPGISTCECNPAFCVCHFISQACTVQGPLVGFISARFIAVQRVGVGSVARRSLALLTRCSRAWCALAPHLLHPRPHSRVYPAPIRTVERRRPASRLLARRPMRVLVAGEGLRAFAAAFHVPRADAPTHGQNPPPWVERATTHSTAARNAFMLHACGTSSLNCPSRPRVA